MARLPAPGQCMEQAAALNTAEPSSDVPTHQPAGTSGTRCLAVRSPQPMQARRQWGVLSLQQQAARPPEPQENNEQQPPQPLPTNRAPLAEHSQNDSDFLDVSRSRGFQGAGPKRRSHRAAPLRNGRPGNAVAPSSVRPVEVAEPLDISPEPIREGDESNEPAREQPQWRRKQGLSMEPAGRADREANLVSTGLQLALNLAASPSDAQGSGAAGTEAAQPREDEGEEETGSRQHEAQDADSMNVSTGHPLAGMSFVPETCLPVLSLPPSDTVPDTPDARCMAVCLGDEESPCCSLEMQPGPSCISVLWLGVGKELHTQSVQRLSSPQQTTCLLVSGEDHMFAAGEGGSVQQWRVSDAADSFKELPALPAAKYGNIEFPNIAQLAPAGPDCILACSSTGSVALWNHARGELLIARQHSAYSVRDLHLLPPSVAASAAGRGLRAGLAAVRDSRLPPEQRGPWRLASVVMHYNQLAVGSSLLDQQAGPPFPNTSSVLHTICHEVTHVAMSGMLAAVALPGGAIHVIDAVQGTTLAVAPPCADCIQLTAISFLDGGALTALAGNAVWYYELQPGLRECCPLAVKTV
ncbi:hypothetical protein COCSUDRAFT_40146 [Coccomyxa subellipsoidea C-169]|uniref:WD40 repeat-like protein n=1 Tax=Coccomyxa subellipsoidea (strain C-169) TaxID=574566 RepID=I0Z5K0_COCSC|nr:hypothetical protein COCSUDRAFT_40146 [Coccomyxa subellipsoidea C-169]EIE25919.1 hypothetical protein COCSUDRAFT_40146 [Coccomyxa subellipsoidea C-169]|eukprot:XP_005650463.1 hypothetical protein COCSUDRAFT_40146 [Coccomyxa subellipsoidea C-169]